MILRPGILSDEPGSGRVRMGRAIPNSVVPRDDVAVALAKLVERPSVKRIIIQLATGRTPVGKAVPAL